MVRGIYLPSDVSARPEAREFTKLEDYQQAVNGWIEAVDVPDLGVTIYVNEEGLLRHLDFNSRATFLWWHYVPAARQQAMLVGNAVIVGMPDKDGNSTDVPEAAYRLLMQHARYAAPFIEVATPVSAVGKSDRSRAQRGATRKSDLAAIRSWANQNGYKVSDRGRVPAAVVEAYDAAH